MTKNKDKNGLSNIILRILSQLLFGVTVIFAFKTIQGFFEGFLNLPVLIVSSFVSIILFAISRQFYDDSLITQFDDKYNFFNKTINIIEHNYALLLARMGALCSVIIILLNSQSGSIMNNIIGTVFGIACWVLSWVVYEDIFEDQYLKKLREDYDNTKV